MLLLIQPPLRSNLPICKFQQLVLEPSSHKEKPYNLEKRSRDGSLQTWEGHRKLGGWYKTHSTQLGRSQRRVEEILKEKERDCHSWKWYIVQGDWNQKSVCQWRYQGVWCSNIRL